MANTTVNIDIEVQSKTLQDLEEELGQVNEELKQVEIGSQAFKELTSESQKLTAQVEKVNREVEGFTFDKKIQAADGAVKLFGGSLAGVVGTLGVLGVESEAFGDFEKKAASAIAVAVGFKDISEGIQQLGPFLKIASTQVSAFAKTTKGALIATGIGAFVVAVGLIAANWDKVTTAVKRFAENVPFVGQAIEGIKNAFNTLFEAARPVLEFLGILPDEAERAQMAIVKQTEENVRNLERQIAIAQAEGQSAKELFDLKKQLIEEEILLLEDQADKEEELFKKRTELLVLEAAERKRLSDEYVGQVERETATVVNSIEAVGVAKMEGAQITANTTGLTSALEKKAAEDTAVAVEQDLQLQELKKQSRMAMLDTIIATTDQESKIGRAAFIARQALLLQSLAIEAKAQLQEIAMKAAGAGVDVSAGFAKTLAKGFPLNVPLLIAYGLQAAAIIKSIKDATRKAKQTIPTGLPSGGGAAGVSSISAPQVTSAPAVATFQEQTEDFIAQAPQFQTVTPTVRAYVLSGDVTTAQEADSKLSRRRTLTD
jgi:hypothetical protein